MWVSVRLVGCWRGVVVVFCVGSRWFGVCVGWGGCDSGVCVVVGGVAVDL